AGAPFARIGEYGGQIARLLHRELAGVDMEMMLRGGLGAKYTIVPFNAVDVDLKDPLLGPEHLDQRGEPCLQPFAEIAAAGPQEQVLGHLLAQRTGPANRATSL